jgi:D-alanyl-D-alanine carboxypeptidase (penicillin-binding protein 5/6)
MKRRFHLLTSIKTIYILPLILLSGIILLTADRTLYSFGNSIQPTPTPVHITYSATPTPLPTPEPVLTAIGKPPAIAATAAYLLDTDTNNVLYDKQGERPLLMASTTKIMTALIALQTGNPNQPIPVKPDAINRVIEDDGSNAGLAVGDTLTLKDMLYALLLPSGDDAAYAIADALGGSQEAFVAHMNLFAQRLHLYQTHFNSSDGLTNDSLTHYSSAHDLAILAQDAMQNPLFRQIVSTQRYTVSTANNTYTWTNTNTLLGTYKGMTGIKTGHTDDAGYCLVFSANRNGHHLLGAVLGSPDQTQRDQDVTSLLNWGFALPMRVPRY